MRNLFIAFVVFSMAIVFSNCSASKHTVKEQPVAPVYQRPASPGAQYVWIDGDWKWRRNKYIYSNGYWSKSKSNRVYSAGTWVNTNKGYYWKKGYWK